MLFQSPEFLLFICVFFVVYWILQRWPRSQNVFTLAASYLFYGWWDARLLGLIAATSGFDYYAALSIQRTSSELLRRRWLMASLLFNLSILGFFKYYNFFVHELHSLLLSVGVERFPNLRLDILLPVGISFYTFQTLSYTVDVYHRRMSAARDPIVLFTYIAFFPQLVAGPIERAGNLIPQFQQPRVFDYATAVSSARLMLWGFFKKLAVADTCAVVVNRCFEHPDQFSGWHLLAGGVMFAFQIYGDFSGYSDIAKGTAGLLGIRLMENFQHPYFSQSPAEFWRRWHISLSTWFRDYVYVPLGGNRVAPMRAKLNVLIVFTLSGLWHGANWTYVCWGLLNGLLIVLLPSAGRSSQCGNGSLFPGLRHCVAMLATFACITAGWIVFRSTSISTAAEYLRLLAIGIIEHPFGLLPVIRWYIKNELCLWPVILLLGVDWLDYCGRWNCDRRPRPLRWAVYLATVSLVIWTAFCRDASEFLYFQF